MTDHKQHDATEHVTEQVAPSAPDDVTQELEQLKKELEETKTKYLRALADYQNYERRVRAEKEDLISFSQIQMALKILPFLDNLEKAEMFIKDPGLKMIKGEFIKVLDEIGLKEVDVLGKAYDPHTAEAIDTVEGEPDNTVAEVLTKGFQFKERVVRPAQVKVYRKTA